MLCGSARLLKDEPDPLDVHITFCWSLLPVDTGVATTLWLLWKCCYEHGTDICLSPCFPCFWVCTQMWFAGSYGNSQYDQGRKAKENQWLAQGQPCKKVAESEYNPSQLNWASIIISFLLLKDKLRRIKSWKSGDRVETDGSTKLPHTGCVGTWTRRLRSRVGAVEDPCIPAPGRFPGGSKYLTLYVKDIYIVCERLFISALPIIAKQGSQPNCPSLKKLVK